MKKRIKRKPETDIFLTAGEDANPLDNESGFYSLSQERQSARLDPRQKNQTDETKKKIAEEKFKKILQDKKDYKILKEKQKQKALQRYEKEEMRAKEEFD